MIRAALAIWRLYIMRLQWCENNLRAITDPAASIGLFINCGSIYETPISSCASHMLERMAFKSTRNRSHLHVVREVEAIGGNTSASASRECLAYTFVALKIYVPEMVELLIDCVRNPAFLDWEVNEEVKDELEEVSKNPERLILEAVHSTGYSGALANPLLAPGSALDRLDSSILEEFVTENYTGNRMVLAASGIEHEELLQIAESLLSDLPAGPHLEEPKSVYVGGDFRQQADSPNTYFALAFEVPGGWNNEKDCHSDCNADLRVLNEYQQIESFSAFNSIFNNTGLFGIYGSTMLVAEDIRRQILTYGERKSIQSFLKMVDEINLCDITDMAEKIISSPLTMASYGDAITCSVHPIPHQIHLLRPQSGVAGRHIPGINLSWLLAVETNNIRGWDVVPQACENILGHYMLGHQYCEDYNAAASVAYEYAKEPETQRRWPTSLSNQPHYAQPETAFG
ncbi:hypothetical protein CRYUN_Cryun34aG0071100 [Craigia yunnanensis]